jgi:ribose transport system ATP-binding protein
VRHLSGKGIRDASLVVHKGEIVGLAGLLGAGRTELVKLIYGAEKVTGGEILIDGRKVAIRSPRSAVHHRIGLIPEDRKREGVYQRFGIDWNTTISCLDTLTTAGFIQLRLSGQL